MWRSKKYLGCCLSVNKGRSECCNTSILDLWSALWNDSALLRRINCMKHDFYSLYNSSVCQICPDLFLPGQQFGQQQQIMTITMATIKMIPIGMVMPIIVPADKVTGVSEIMYWLEKQPTGFLKTIFIFKVFYQLHTGLIDFFYNKQFISLSMITVLHNRFLTGFISVVYERKIY